MQKKRIDKFIKLPEYPGGREQFKEFVLKNLNYPKEALEKAIEGTVILNAEITDRGVVQDIKIEKRLGFGCDEEAIRILSLAKFGEVKNRGLRVKTRKTFRITFNLPKNTPQIINYSLKKSNPQIASKPKSNYSYSISFGQNQS